MPGQDHGEKCAVAIILTFAAGCVDIVGYLSAYHVFTAHMTGNPDTVRKASFILSIWCAYALGAIAGTGLESKWHVRTLQVPFALLCVAIMADQILPLSVEEEKDQFEW